MSDLKSEISRWCKEQLNRWSETNIDYSGIINSKDLKSPHVGLMEISGIKVSMRSETSSLSSAILQRMGLYKAFLGNVLAAHGPIGHSIYIRLDASDEPDDYIDLPTFSFQKKTGSSNILLPDVDFFYHDFYLSGQFVDTESYGKKSNTAVFVGSTTGGGHITQEKVVSGLVPRIKSAMFFSNYPQVDFRLPRLVQLDRPETEQMLRSMGFGIGEMTWSEQLKHKFLISLDGNGATCSRILVGLRSNSVLLKYQSSSELFYFSSLKPDEHFVQIVEDDDVLKAISIEERRPGYHEAIATRSAEFCNYYLGRNSIELYTHQLLVGYSELVGRGADLGAGTRTPPRSTADSLAQIPPAASDRRRDADFSSDLRTTSMQNSIPDHRGTDYRRLIANVHEWLAPETYLEIGVEQGHTFMLSRAKSIGIDPAFKFTDLEVLNSLSTRPVAGLYRMPSDDFFRKFDPTKLLGGFIDLAFLDGMHWCEYLLRDFIHTERFCRQASTIMLHDCCPPEIPMADRQPGLPAIEAHHEGWWTGDVWRTALALKRCRHDLKITAFDAAPTGLICITNLDPDSTFLADNYFTIVDDMRSWHLSNIGLDNLMAELGVLSTDVVSNEEQMRSILSLS